MSFGSTLRAAREACGITTSELAARTHMLVQIVEGLENENFRRIPAPIYGRGFVKLYCEAVGIDPKPLQAEFMELFNKPRNTASEEIASKNIRPASVPEPVRQMIEEQPEASPQSTASIAQELEPRPQPSQSSQPDATDFGELFEQPPKRSYGDIFGHSYASEEKSEKPSAAEKFRTTMSNVSSGVFSNVQKLPVNIERIVKISLCAVLCVVLLVWGITALYKATNPAKTDSASISAGDASGVKSDRQKSDEKTKRKSDGASAAKASLNSTGSTKSGGLKSSGVDIPALYID